MRILRTYSVCLPQAHKRPLFSLSFPVFSSSHKTLLSFWIFILYFYCYYFSIFCTACLSVLCLPLSVNSKRWQYKHIIMCSHCESSHWCRYLWYQWQQGVAVRRRRKRMTMEMLPRPRQAGSEESGSGIRKWRFSHQACITSRFRDDNTCRRYCLLFPIEMCIPGPKSLGPQTAPCCCCCCFIPPFTHTAKTTYDFFILLQIRIIDTIIINTPQTIWVKHPVVKFGSWWVNHFY